jgi:protein-L-isoaspartate(D-aspartate) O-methyltransferase
VTTLQSPEQPLATGTSFTAARRAMIDSQLRTSGVTADFAVDRMRSVPREDFVPAAMRDVAYVDRAVPLGDGHFLASPLVHGMMLQEARPLPTDNVLLVDCGSGYLAELVRPLVASLTVASPAEAQVPAAEGKKADLVLIDGAIEQMPAALAERVADNGRVVTGLVEDGVTSIARGRKSGEGVAFLKLGEIGIPRLPEFDKPKGWSF